MPKIGTYYYNTEHTSDIRMLHLLPTSCRGPLKAATGPNSNVIRSLYVVVINSLEFSEIPGEIAVTGFEEVCDVPPLV